MNPKKYIPHPEAERGGAHALLLFILAFTAVSFTLVAGSGTGRKKDGMKTDRQCTYGSTVHLKDSQGKIIGCERPQLSMQICKDCTSTDSQTNCICEAKCVPNGSMQAGVWEKRTITQTKDVDAGTKLDARWKFVSINGNGTWKYEKKVRVILSAILTDYKTL